jgi:hypothetical protein
MATLPAGRRGGKKYECFNTEEEAEAAWLKFYTEDAGFYDETK